MPSDTLIDELVDGLRPVRPRAVWRDGGLLALVGLAELAIYLAMDRMRPDMPEAMREPAMWWKLAGLAALALAATVAAVGALDPARNARGGVRLAGALGAVVLAVGWWLDAMVPSDAALWARLDWQMGLDCAVGILLLSLPPAFGFGWRMRQGAATDSARAGLVAGIASAAWGAFVFAFHCPSDDSLYVAVWYSLAVGVVAASCRWVLPRLSRW